MTRPPEESSEEEARKGSATGDDDEFTAPADPVLRFVRPVFAALLTLGSLAWSVDLYRALGLVLFPEQFLAGMFGIALGLVFVHYPARRGTVRTRVPAGDLAVALVGFGAGAYVAVTFPELSERVQYLPGGDVFEGLFAGKIGLWTFLGAFTYDIVIVALIFVVLAIEGLRRAVGNSLVIIVVVCIGYALVGHLVPGSLETRKVEFRSFVAYLALDTGALLGLAMVVGTTVVITFVFFGQLLMRSGGSQFFNDVSLILMGRFRGGSAKISIIASSLFGSVSGVAVSNIVATGVVTIPMMKRSGFSPRFAGAVEAVASTGGQLMPPVMGAVAFLMADFLERSYQEIVVAALVPSLLYYVGLFIQADLEAAKAGIRRVPKEEIPRAGAVLATGWVFLMPFVALIWALFTLNWEPETAAMLASGTVLLIALLLIMVGHVQQRSGHHFPETPSLLPAALCILLPMLCAIWLPYALDVLDLTYAYLLTGAAALVAFFAGGLAVLVSRAGGGGQSALGAVAAFGGYLLRVLPLGALPGPAVMVALAWIVHAAGGVSLNLLLFELPVFVSVGTGILISVIGVVWAVMSGSRRLAGRAQQAGGGVDGAGRRTSETVLAGGRGMAEVVRISLVRAGLSTLDILMIVAAAGFIIGTLNVTGLGFALTALLVDFGGSNLFVLLIIAAMLCIVLGMGMPTVGVYILLAVLVAPSLEKVGVDRLAAHMFILYLGMMSLITPPVAVAAFFAANIARAPPMQTGWTSVRFGWTAFVVPFLFVFSPSLLLQGETVDLVIDVSSAILGVWLLSTAMIGYFLLPMGGRRRLVFAAAGVALLLPRGIDMGSIGLWVTDEPVGWFEAAAYFRLPVTALVNAAGLILAVVAVGAEVLARRRRRAAKARAA